MLINKYVTRSVGKEKNRSSYSWWYMELPLCFKGLTSFQHNEPYSCNIWAMGHTGRTWRCNTILRPLRYAGKFTRARVTAHDGFRARVANPLCCQPGY